MLKQSDIFQNIANAIKTDDRPSARTRFYCDNDEDELLTKAPASRWQRTPDIPGARIPNSQRTLGEDQEWREVVNHVLTDIVWKPCYQDTDLQAMTTGEKLQAGNWPGEAAQRYVTTVSIINS